MRHSSPQIGCFTSQFHRSINRWSEMRHRIHIQQPTDRLILFSVPQICTWMELDEKQNYKDLYTDCLVEIQQSRDLHIDRVRWDIEVQRSIHRWSQIGHRSPEIYTQMELDGKQKSRDLYINGVRRNIAVQSRYIYIYVVTDETQQYMISCFTSVDLHK